MRHPYRQSLLLQLYMAMHCSAGIPRGTCRCNLHGGRLEVAVPSWQYRQAPCSAPASPCCCPCACDGCCPAVLPPAAAWPPTCCINLQARRQARRHLQRPVLLALHCNSFRLSPFIPSLVPNTRAAHQRHPTSTMLSKHRRCVLGVPWQHVCRSATCTHLPRSGPSAAAPCLCRLCCRTRRSASACSSAATRMRSAAAAA